MPWLKGTLPVDILMEELTGRTHLAASRRGLATSLRRRMTPPEVRLWVRLRSRHVNGVAVRRQHPEGPYVLDFYCDEAKLAIEVDCSHHYEDAGLVHDARRDASLSEEGIETLRVPAGHIMQDADAAAEMVMDRIRSRLSELGFE